MHNTSKLNSSDLFSEVTNNSSENHEIYINLSTIFGEIPPHSSPSNEEYLAILERAKDYLPLPIDSQKQRYCIFSYLKIYNRNQWFYSTKDYLVVEKTHFRDYKGAVQIYSKILRAQLNWFLDLSIKFEQATAY